MKFSKLNSNPKNPRKITPEKLAQLEKSLKAYGSLDGFVYNKKTGNLISGHQRQKIFKDARIIGDYVVWRDYRFPYREVNWSESKEKAAMIAANQNAGAWDEEILGELFLDLKEFDLDLTMFDEEERKEFLPEESKKGLCDDDEVPKSKKTGIILGDLFKLGSHRLLCGDSTNPSQVSRLMGGEKADMVFTDPPYGISLDSDRFKNTVGIVDSMDYMRKKHLKTKSHGDIQSDDRPFDANFLVNYFNYVKEIFIFGANNFCHTIPDYPKGSWTCWDRTGGAENLEEMLGSSFELCWSKQRHKYRIARVAWKGVLGHSKTDDGDKKVHPSMKPVKLVEWFFEHWGKDAKLIVDLYLGSGSTLIACEKTNRKCYGMEIDPQYCQVIIDRWEKFTGKKAKQIGSRKKT